VSVVAGNVEPGDSDRERVAAAYLRVFSLGFQKGNPTQGQNRDYCPLAGPINES
jgi:hypothetical protein